MISIRYDYVIISNSYNWKHIITSISYWHQYYIDTNIISICYRYDIDITSIPYHDFNITLLLISYRIDIMFMWCLPKSFQYHIDVISMNVLIIVLISCHVIHLHDFVSYKHCLHTNIFFIYFQSPGICVQDSWESQGNKDMTLYAFTY